MTNKTKGSFTLPGEAGYEALTLKLAQKWGADVIRDSDGTALSSEILNAGYSIYSTLCIIRDHNEFAKQNSHQLQQCFLMSMPKVADQSTLDVKIIEGYFEEQFAVNDSEKSIAYWQVFDRTTNKEVPRNSWTYDEKTQTVRIHSTIPWHKYTVNFLVYRIWEEISMYNHTTNNWQKEHLMQLDPRHTSVQQYLLEWMENWCKANLDTNVVRFTSMFYNFVWIWGADSRNPHLFTDWASYDFTVSPEALEAFEKQYGYALTSEDFINKGKLQPTHCPADARKLDYMAFINDFVISFGKQLVDIVHRYNKLAYVFYDDSWVGVEPCGERFEEFGFDGIIKCVFSGFEARLCNSVKGVKTHELRLHPYLFPVGLGGAPTFMSGGDPTLEAKKFWNSVRRALLRAPIDRIGLGGYLHLTEDFLDFTDYIEKVADEFRSIKSLHEEGRPYSLSPKIGILTSWGKLRAWTCSGHYHEHPDLDLINILESLSGLPFEVEFLSFEEIKQGAAKDFSVIINAGTAGSAWIGGSAWQEEAVVEALTEWVYHGGAFIGVNEPSAQAGYDRFFRMAHVLGVDKDTGERLCHGKWTFEEQAKGRQIVGTGTVTGKPLIYLTDGKAEVLMQDQGMPALTTYDFGKGRGMYLSSYTHSIENTRMLLNTILYATGESESQHYITDNCYVECAYYPESHKLVVINNSGKDQSTVINTQEGSKTVELMPYDTQIVML